jgi:DNA-binding IclR family transcriptional regulator
MKESRSPAPALEKGLEVLELLGGQNRALSAAEIAAMVDRSKAEIYRTLVTLEQQGFISQDSDLRYKIADFVYDIGMSHPPRSTLIEAATSHIRRLARETHQSCHLSVSKNGFTTVVARAESDAIASFAVKVGYTVSWAQGTSSRVIFAFQSEARQVEWLNAMRQTYDPQVVHHFKADAAEVVNRGYILRNSSSTRGITDLGVPIFNGQQPYAIAALIVPFVSYRHSSVAQTDVLSKLIETAKLISRDLV